MLKEAKANLKPGGSRSCRVRREPDDVDVPDGLERRPRYPAFDGPAPVLAAEEKVQPDLHVLRSNIILMFNTKQDISESLML
jgi:hypothetical protein